MAGSSAARTLAREARCTAPWSRSVEDTYPGAAKVRTEGGTGPLYVVNVGSVFKEAYEVLCAESQLQSRPEEPGPL